ncbi:MAG: caspase family protein [Spirochaetales bacterium]|nr:caspase family protein [Spirochaetales bacterium]
MTKTIYIILLLLILSAGVFPDDISITGNSVFQPPALTGNENREAVLYVQQGATDSIFAAHFSGDGKYLLTGGYDTVMKLWNFELGREMRTFSGHKGSIFDMYFTLDGKYAISAGSDKQIIIWHIPTGKIVKILNGHTAGVTSLSVSRDEKLMVSGSRDKLCILWNLEDGGIKKIFRGHKKEVNAVCISGDGKYIASAGTDKTVIIWDGKTSGKLRTLVGHKEAVMGLAFSADGKFILSASEDGTVRLWETATGKMTKNFDKHPAGVEGIRDVYFYDHDTQAVSVGFASVMFWDIKTGRDLRKFEAHRQAVSKAVISPDEKYLLACEGDRIGYLWDIRSERVIKTFEGHSYTVKSALYTENGNKIVFGGGFLYKDDDIKIWDLRMLLEERRLTEQKGSKDFLALAGRDKYLVSASDNNSIALWDFDTGGLLQTFTGHSGWFNSASIGLSGDGKYLYSGNVNDQKIKIWDTRTGKELKNYNVPKCYSIQIYPERQSAVLGYTSENYKLMDISTGKQEDLFIKFPHAYYSLEFSPDWKYVLTAHKDITLWDYKTRKKLRDYNGFKVSVSSIDFSRDGKSFLAIHTDNTISVWETETGKRLNVFQGPPHPFYGVYTACFSPDGKRVLAGNNDGTCFIWNVKTGSWVSFVSSKDSNEWVVYTDDGYWDSSRNGGNLVAMVSGMNVWNIDQFAVRNNRPDIILERLGIDNPGLIEHYRTLYLRRLKKLGLTEGTLSSDLQIPVVKITDTRVKGKTAEIKFSLNDNKYRVIAYNIYVNDVPVFAPPGKEINKKSVTLTGNVELTRGINKIEISCLNEKGAESYRAPAQAAYEGDVRRNLYFIGFGVSRYKDASLNLKYAHQDVLDLADMFSSLDSSFNKVNVKTYTDDEVTKEAILRAKEFLKEATVDDTFVLFISGHGVHDRDQFSTYYYLTHDADIDNLSGTAADFESIEKILQGVAPRNKLFLMDTCESGEVEDGLQSNYYAMAGKRGINARTVRGLTVRKSERPARRPFLLHQNSFIYNDLLRRSGAIVFSSSRGGEFSYESDECRNGFFTEEIINAIKNKKADGNGDNQVTIDELEEYVMKAVPLRTDNLQNPTVDRDNIYIEFGFPVKP